MKWKDSSNKTQEATFENDACTQVVTGETTEGMRKDRKEEKGVLPGGINIIQ